MTRNPAIATAIDLVNNLDISLAEKNKEPQLDRFRLSICLGNCKVKVSAMLIAQGTLDNLSHKLSLTAEGWVVTLR